MIYFIKCIRDHRNAINYDIAHIKTAYKHRFESFYRQIHKKKYKSQILNLNIRHANVIAIQNIPIIAKILFGSIKKRAYYCYA